MKKLSIVDADLLLILVGKFTMAVRLYISNKLLTSHFCSFSAKQLIFMSPHIIM